MKLRNSDLEWADIIYLGRFDSWYEQKLAERMKAAGDRTVYYIDDDLPNVPQEIKCSDYYGRADIKKHIRACIELSGAILTPSPILLQKYTTVQRPGILFQSAAFLPGTYTPHQEAETIKIGFAGSLDRSNDLDAMLSQTLKQVKAKYKERISLQFYGAIPSFAKEVDAVCIPYEANYLKYRQKLNELNWDIGLAPMPDTPFHACKHYNKFIEYGSSAIAGIYSDVSPYLSIPQRETVGRFCKNTPEAWMEAICTEIEDNAAREAHREMAWDICLQQFSLDHVTEKLLEAQEECLSKGSNQKIKLRRLPLIGIKLANIWFRGSGFIKQNRFKTIQMIPRIMGEKLQGEKAKKELGA